MKKIIHLSAILLLLLTNKSLHAQNSFAPVGAEWWYFESFNEFPTSFVTNSTFHTRSVGDTIIAGIPCRKVTTDTLSVTNDPSGMALPVSEDFFFYDNTDTVFIYNENFNKFTPVYVFNAQEGDTICLPVPPTPYGSADLRLNPISGDTSFCFVIDSIRVRQYDTVHFRTYYTRALVESDGSGGTAYPAYNWEGGFWYPGDVNTGKYIEHIIGNFLPYKLVTCVDCWPYTYAPYGLLRCYSDSAYSIKLRPEACDLLPDPPRVGIHTPESTKKILHCYPNPAGKDLTIALLQPSASDILISFSDLTGRKLQQTVLPRMGQKMTVDVHSWPEGIYLLRCQSGEQVFYDKIIIKH